MSGSLVSQVYILFTPGGRPDRSSSYLWVSSRLTPFVDAQVYPRAGGGRAGGGHALSREVHPPEDRGAAPRAAPVPDGDLGLRDGNHRPRGQPAVQRVGRRREDRLPHRGHRPRSPAGTSPDTRLSRRPPGLRRADGPEAQSHRDRPGRGEGPQERQGRRRTGGDGRGHLTAPHLHPGRPRRRRLAAPQCRGGHRQPGPGPRPLQPSGRTLLHADGQSPRGGQRGDGPAGPRPRQRRQRPRTALP